MKPEDVIEKIEFKQSKDFIVDVIREKVAEKAPMQADDGSHFELGTKRVFINPAMLVVIDVYDGYLEIGKKGMGDQLVGLASNIIKQAIKKDESNGGSMTKQGGSPQSGIADDISVEEKLKLVQLLKSIKELLDVGAISEEEYNEQKEQILNKLNKTNKVQEEPKAPVEEKPVEPEPQPQPEPEPEPVQEEAPVEEEVQPVEDPIEEPVEEQPVEEETQQVEEPTPEEPVVEEQENEVPSEEPVQEEVKDKEYYDNLAREAKVVFNKERKFKKAYEMLLEASKGSELGKYYLANFCYLRGWGTKKNVPEAKRILEELAANGYEKAIKALEDL